MQALALVFVLLASIPASGEAPTFQQALQAEREGRLEEAIALLTHLSAAEPSNGAARLQLQRLRERQNRAEALRMALSRIILPAVRLEDVSAREAMDYLTRAITKSQPGFRLNIVWMVPPEHPGRVSLQLDGIPASEALRYAAEAAGLTISFDEHAVKIRAPASPASIPAAQVPKDPS